MLPCCSRYTGNATQNIGELSGAATSTLTIDAAPRAVTWSIGGLNTSSTFSGAITNGNGTSTLTKVGSGTLTLGGTSTFTGAVNVNNGTVELNSTGVITQSGSLAVKATATTSSTSTAVRLPLPARPRSRTTAAPLPL